MLKDFLITDNVGIKVGVRYADLHNDYDLVQVRLNYPESTAEIEFKRRREIMGDSHPVSIVLQFSNVDWFQTSPRVVSLASNDLAEIGYKDPMDTDHDWLIREEQATSEAHLFLRLTNDEFIRIHARRARALFTPT